MKTEVMAFLQTINPGETVSLSERLKDNGSVTEVRVRFYPGVQKALQVHPYILHTLNRAEEILTYSGADKMITGDDDYFVFPVQSDFEIDDQFVVNVKNNDSVYSYSLCVFVVVHYNWDELNL